MLIEPRASDHDKCRKSSESGQVEPEDRPLCLDEKLLLTAEEVAGLLGLSRSRVFELLYAKTIVSVKIGKSRRVRRTDLEAFVESLDEDS